MQERTCKCASLDRSFAEFSRSDRVPHKPPDDDPSYVHDWTLDGNDPAPPVVATALLLWAEHSDLPAIAVLDLAMRLHAGEDLDYEFDPELELAPPHPFAELIRRAFAPEIDAADLATSFVDVRIEDRVLQGHLDRIRRRWHRAILCFARRYQLWEPTR
jgi:hypothetical protein